MDLQITFTCTCNDDQWGWSDLLNGRPLNDKTKTEIIDLLFEDIISVLDGQPFTIKQIKNVKS